MVYLDGDIDENDEINLNDLVYLEAYSFGTEGYEINEDRIYNTAIKNENFDSTDGRYPYISQAITVMKKYIIGEAYELQPEAEPESEYVHSEFVFSGTPPSTINFTSGNWKNNGWNYVRTTYTNTSAIYDLSVDETGSNYGIVFSISNNQLTLDVNDPTYGPNNPVYFSINGTLASNPDIISVGDTIVLLNTSGVGDATFTVPNEFAPA